MKIRLVELRHLVRSALLESSNVVDELTKKIRSGDKDAIAVLHDYLLEQQMDEKEVVITLVELAISTYVPVKRAENNDWIFEVDYDEEYAVHKQRIQSDDYEDWEEPRHDFDSDAYKSLKRGLVNILGARLVNEDRREGARIIRPVANFSFGRIDIRVVCLASFMVVHVTAPSGLF